MIPILLIALATDVERLEHATRAAFAPRDVAIEILNHAPNPLPPGAPEFTRSGLPRPPIANPGAPVKWRGSLQLPTGRTIPIIVTALVREQQTWVEAADTLPSGQVVAETQLRLRSELRFPSAAELVASIVDVVGMRPRRTVRRGETLTPALFVPAPAITRGDLVTVQVVSGAVTLAFGARAEVDGRPGDYIVVKALDPARRHKVKVAEKGKVIIDAKTSAPVLAAARGR